MVADPAFALRKLEIRTRKGSLVFGKFKVYSFQGSLV